MSVWKRRTPYTTTTASPAAALVSAALMLGLGCSPAETRGHPVEGGSLTAAKRAYFQFDLDGASAVLTRIREDEAAPPEDRAEAGRRLARIAALFDQDLARARRLLAEAGALERDEVPTLLMLAQIEREGK